ncbi:MAG TPA: cupin domain-containing protein [Gaiellaceae bacterium]|nr:cupin domain-containing protein [Gaiellaceae bacterium]
MAVPEVVETEHGLMPRGRGWFVLNGREARWFDRKGQGYAPGLQGTGDFPQLGLGLNVLGPGEPMAMYHWETDQEDFLVLAGEALLIIEGEERTLRQWDFVHCPPGTSHVIVGAGDGPCVVFAVGALENHTVGSRVDGTLEGTDDWGAYTVDEAAIRHGAGVEVETNDADVAYARFPEPKPTRYREGLLPGSDV